MEVGSGPGNEGAETPSTTNPDKHKAKEEAYWRQQVFWSAWTAIVAVLAVAAASIYAYFAYQQVCETQKLVVEQTKATLAAQRSADAATIAANTAHDAFVVSISADLVPDISCEIVGNDMQIKVKVINKGNSVAKDVWLGWWFVRNGKDMCRAGPKTKGGVYEGDTYNRVAIRLEKDQVSEPMGLLSPAGCTGEQTVAMEQAAVIDIQNGTINFGIAGHIDYTDVAGGYHLVPFSYGYIPIYNSSTPPPWTCKFAVVQSGNSVYANQ
jgi:hypothetical protein